MQCFNPIADCPKHYRVRVCTCTCTRVRARAHRRRRPQGKELVLSFPLTTGLGSLAGWEWQALRFVLCSLPASLLRASREMLSSGTQKGGNVAGARLTPGDQSKTKQVNGAERKESKRKSRRVPETRLCALTDLVPWDWSKSQGCSLAPLKTA